MEERQLSWLSIEPGWRVVSSDGVDVGSVEQTVGASDKDIFNGLSVSLDSSRAPRYVLAERVGRIFDGRVKLLVSAAEAERLDEFQEPPQSLDIDPGPDEAPRSKRVISWLRSRRRRNVP